MIALAALPAWWVVPRELQRLTGRGDAAVALVGCAVLGGLVGARLDYALEHLGSEGLLQALAGTGFTW